MSFEDLLNRLNEKYKFKVIIFLLLALPSFQNYSQLQNALIALSKPKFQCLANTKKSSVSVDKDNCHYRDITTNLSTSCTKWNFSSEPFGKTQVSEFSLVCDKSYFTLLLLISWYATSLIAPLIGIMSDKYGRKVVALVNLMMETIMTVALSFSPDLISTFISRILLGISGCDIFICFVWLMEMVDEDFRTFSGSFYWIFGCLAYATFPLIVYFTRDWRYTQLISVLPNLFYLFIFFIPESPRWLLSMNRKSEAKVAVERIKKFNNLKFQVNEDDLYVEEEKIGKLKQILRSPVFIKRSLIAFLMQFSIYIYWSAVTVDLTILSTNPYLTIFLMGLMETPSVFLTFISLMKINRKRCILCFGGVGSTLFLLTEFLNKSIQWQLGLRIFTGCIAKICIATVLQTTLVYFIELFPTTHRSFSLIFVQLANFVSFCAAIFVNKLSAVTFFLPMLCYFVLFWISYILVECNLPETRDLPIPEHMRDIEMLIRGKEDEYQFYFDNTRTRESFSTDSSNNKNIQHEDEQKENEPLLKKTTN